ncbi:hypothetical protein Bca4012_026360 [Brassica carinata]
MSTLGHKVLHLSNLRIKGEIRVLRLVKVYDRAPALAEIANKLLSFLKTLKLSSKRFRPSRHLICNHPPSSPFRPNKSLSMKLSLLCVLRLYLLSESEELSLSFFGLEISNPGLAET